MDNRLTRAQLFKLRVAVEQGFLVDYEPRWYQEQYAQRRTLDKLMNMKLLYRDYIADKWRALPAGEALIKEIDARKRQVQP